MTENSPKIIKAAMVAASLDLPARAKVLNMRQFNGEHGCHLCECPGKNSPENRLFRWWPHDPAAVLRTKESFLKNSIAATSENKVVISYVPICLLEVNCCYNHSSAWV